MGNARAASFAHADFDDAEGLERAQRVARNDATGIKPRRQVFFGAEKITGPQPLGKQRITHLGHDLGGERRRAARQHDAGCGVRVRLERHSKGFFDGRILKIISLLSNYRCYL